MSKGVTIGWAQPTPQLKCCIALIRTNNEQVSDFMQNFNGDMFKMHYRYFRNKFSKIAKRWGFPASSALLPSILVI